MFSKYQLYCVDGDGRVSIQHEYETATDQDALMRACELCENCAVDVWQGSRFIASIATNGTLGLDPFFGRLN